MVIGKQELTVEPLVSGLMRIEMLFYEVEPVTAVDQEKVDYCQRPDHFQRVLS
jgi:hypothetical protein